MENCIFCKIAAGEIPSYKVYEDENCIGILDIGPANPGHTLIIPKTHGKDLTEMKPELVGKLMGAAGIIGKRQIEGLKADGFNVVQNNGAAAGQTVMHYHIHVIPRYKTDAPMVAWKPLSPSKEELEEIYGKLK